MRTDDKNIAQAVRVGGASLDLTRFESDAHNPRRFGDVLNGRIRSSLLWPLVVLCLVGPIGASANDEDGRLPDGTEPVHANDFALEGPPPATLSSCSPDDVFPEGSCVYPGEELSTENLHDPLILEFIKFNMPTDAKPSPLFGAKPFTQQMLRFEEFGPEPMPTEQDVDDLLSSPAYMPLPGVPNAWSGPDNVALDDFLAQGMAPYPTRKSNEDDANPWQPAIQNFLERSLSTPPAEGRPPGEMWAHQRWSEFPPETYVKTAQAGARMNLGLRDGRQLHDYSNGEFAAGGLYHNTVGASGFDGSTDGIKVRFHPSMPIQDPNALWTFDGTLPPKLLNVRYGEPILFRHYNTLPIDPAANYGFGLHTLSTHEHNGHNPAESDGYTQAFFFPGQYFDYRWPLALAGHDSINTDASDPRAGAPDGNGGITQIPGDWRETMSTHWFHDHMLDFTAQNVYKGNAAMMNYYSALDRGREPASSAEAIDGAGKAGYGCHYADPDNNVNLCLPSGTVLDWGNRDYDVNLLIADKAWDADGQLFFSIFNTDGFVGDRVLTNWLWKPYFNVRARRYRLRILNGAVSRYFKFALVTDDDKPVPFHMVANDGNIMEHAIHFPKGELPTQAIAERYDIIVDFSQFDPGTTIYMVNLLEHRDGRGPKKAIKLKDVLSGKYKSKIKDDQWIKGDPTVGKFLQFRVQDYSGTDRSLDPADYVPAGLKMIPLPGFTHEELLNARHRTFEFGRSSGTDSAPWTIKTDGGKAFSMDPRRLSAAPEEGGVEIWHIRNGGGGWSHPIHVHFEEGQIFKRGGEPPPPWEQWARKDVYRIGNQPDSTDSVDIAIRFREFLGSYMEHCHNTQHEDHAMLLRWDIENPGAVTVMPTPMPTWDGCGFVDSIALPTFRSGDLALIGDPVLTPSGDLGDTSDSGGTPPPPPPPDPPLPDPDPGPANEPPVASGDSITTSEDTSVSFTLSVSDPDGDDADLTFDITSGPDDGELSGTAPDLTYTPAGGFSGSDAFTFSVSDGIDSVAATVSISVDAAPDPGGTDALEVTKAEFRKRKSEWRVEGTGSVAGAVVTIHAGSSLAATTVIGTASVNSVGAWTFRQKNSSVSGSSTISVASTLGGELIGVSVKQK